MDEKLFSARMAEYKSAVDKYLDVCLEETQCASYHKLTDSMHYSLTAGGKRLRAILVLEFCRICGGDVEKALPVACGVEMLHTYSLIHDDLPVMDNDDLRRGKPSNHKVFGECTATLAGDALQALAFETVLKADLPALRVLKCAQVLANAAGHAGICGGQQLDLEWEGKILSARGNLSAQDERAYPRGVPDGRGRGGRHEGAGGGRGQLRRQLRLRVPAARRHARCHRR